MYVHPSADCVVGWTTLSASRPGWARLSAVVSAYQRLGGHDLINGGHPYRAQSGSQDGESPDRKPAAPGLVPPPDEHDSAATRDRPGPLPLGGRPPAEGRPLGWFYPVSMLQGVYSPRLFANTLRSPVQRSHCLVLYRLIRGPEDRRESFGVSVCPFHESTELFK